MFDLDNLRKLREQCLIKFPLKINQYNNYIEDANGAVILAVYGQAGNIAPYLVEAVNALPELLDEVERLREALPRACAKIINSPGCPCPDDVHEWCPGKCPPNTAECWEQYFLEKARGE